MITSMEMSAREVKKELLVSGQEYREKVILTLVYFTYKNPASCYIFIFIC